MSQTFSYNLKFNSNGDAVFSKIEDGFSDIEKSTRKATKSFGDCFKSLLSVSLAFDGLENLKSGLDNLIKPGVSLNTQMADLSAITGLVGDGLDKIEVSARKNAKAFGNDASDSVESYKLLLSQLSPEIATNDKALAGMGNNVSILSKTMKGDTVAATNVLTTAMNQYGVSLDDPIKASEIMGNMMNVMAAGAKEGSAELPQIQAALEQAGLSAKTANVSFEETNAAIQVLDKAGKKGSEGGVALRNVMATLSQGRFLPKDVKEQLATAGVDLRKLTDTTIPLTERLRGLSPVTKDTALITKLFGKENQAAALALLNNVDAIDDLKEKMTGTSTAVEQAEVVMGSYVERMKRTKAWATDLKISFFNITESLLPYAQNTLTVMTSLGKLATGMVSLSSIMGVVQNLNWKGAKALLVNTFWTKKNTVATTKNIFSKMKMGIASKWAALNLNILKFRMMGAFVWAKIMATGFKSVARSFAISTLGAVGFKIALDALGIGLLITAVVGLVYGLNYLWENSRKFHEILGYIGGVGKAIFHNIGIYATRLWNLVLKPITKFIWNAYSTVFKSIWSVVKTVFKGISTAISYLWNEVLKPIASFIGDYYTTVFTGIWNVITWVFKGIITTGKTMWNWFSETFSGFANWINEVLIAPIRSAFTGIWDWITELLDGIFSKLDGLLAPIKALWNALFSSEGTVNIHQTGLEGAEKSGADFDQKKEAEKKGKITETIAVNLKKEEPTAFDLGATKIPKTKPIGGVAAKSVKNNTNTTESGGKNIGSLNINKLVENINIYQEKGQMTKNQIVQMIKEALGTAVADYSTLN